MQKYLELISGFLQKEESCFLPGIGVLKYERQSAIEKDELLLPPSSQVVLAHSETRAQHHIIDAIKDYFHFSKEEATAEWNKILDKINTQKQSVVVPAIGEISRNKDNAFTFNAYSLATFYEPVSLPKDLQSSGKQQPYEEKQDHSKKTSYVLIPLIILVVIVSGYFGYQYLFNSPVKTIKEDSTVTPVETTGPPLTSTPTTDSVNAREATLQKTETTDSVHFAVIYIVYHNRYNAEKHYKKMRNWGHDVSIYQEDSSTFMVGYPFFELPEDTAKRLEEIQDTYGGNPFIIYPEK